MEPSNPSASFPAFTMTSVLSHPRVGDGGVVTVTELDDTDWMTPALPFPKSTSFTPDRFDPAPFPVVPPAARPEDVERAVIAGQVLGGGACNQVTRALATGVPSPVARS